MIEGINEKYVADLLTMASNAFRRPNIICSAERGESGGMYGKMVIHCLNSTACIDGGDDNITNNILTLF